MLRSRIILLVPFFLALTVLPVRQIEQRATSNPEQPSGVLKVENLSVYTSQPEPPAEVTISFEVVNTSSDTTPPFQTRIFPGVHTANGLEPYEITTSELAPGQSVYISKTVTLPDTLTQVDIKIAPDVDGVVSPGANVVAKPFLLLPPVPGQWISIGPRRVTSPAVPELCLGPYNAVGRLAAIAVHPLDRDVIYVGSPGELGHEGTGVWKTSNGGLSWRPITDSLPTLSIAAIAIDPTMPERVYIATADFGLFRSDNGGTSWIHVFTSDLRVRRNTGDGDRTVLLIDPVEPNVLYLSTDDGVMRSENSGLSWTASLEEGTGTAVDGSATALVMDPLDHQTLYAALQGWGVYKTIDGGTHWVKQDLLPDLNSPPYGILLAMSHPSPASSPVVYALLGSTRLVGSNRYENYKLFRTSTATSDGVNLWEARGECDSELLSDCKFWNMFVDPVNPNRIYVSGPILLTSPNGELQFGRVPSVVGKEDRQPEAPHGDYHGWAFDPLDSKIVFAATDGGIYRSSNYALTDSWTFIGEGITNAEIYDLAEAATRSPLIIAGTQDNGNIRYQGSVVWDHIQPVVPVPSPAEECDIRGPILIPYCIGCGGDGGNVAIDPTNRDRLYVMGQSAWDLQWSKDGGGSFSPFPLPTSTRCTTFNQTFHFQAHPAIPGFLAASCGDSLWFGLPGTPIGSLWDAVSIAPPRAMVRSGIDPSIGLYYVGSAAGHVHAGPFGPSQTFNEVFAHPQALRVSDIEVDPDRPSTVFVSFAPPTVIDRKCGIPGGRIYQLTRHSLTPNSETTTAVDITGNLPLRLCVNTLAVDRNVPSVIYAGTSKGVYRGQGPIRGSQVRSVATWTWEPYNNGMPPADVRDLEVNAKTGRMHAGTYGRGAFEVFTVPARR